MANHTNTMDTCVLRGPHGPHLPSLPGAPRTLVEALGALVHEHARTAIFYDRDMTPSELSYAELLVLVQQRAAALQRLCPEPGARVALLVVDCRDFVVTFCGAVWAGLVPVPLAPPAMLRQRGYTETIASVLRAARASALVASAELCEVLAPLQSAELRLCSVAALGSSERLEQPLAVDPSELCFLQFTSGSTAAPKGVRVSHRNLIENVAVIGLRLELRPERDVFLSWLPLYHDMGLIGFLLVPLVNRVPLVLYPTASFVWRPSSWLQLADRHRATVSFAPNFAFGLAARRQKNVVDLNLSCVRVLGCGAEPIHAETLRRFIDTFAPARLSPHTVMPAYGMAEHTLAIAFESYREPLRTLLIDRALFESKGRVRCVEPGEDLPTLELVSCGKPFDRHELAIAAPDGHLLPEGVVGEIVLRGPSVTHGYFDDIEGSRALFMNDWMRTGDAGFIYAGDVYVSGRIKDVMIVNGRNLYPPDLEWTLESIPGLRSGRVAVFSVPHGDTEAVVIVTEPLGAGSKSLRETIEARATELLGVAPHDVVFVANNQIPQTSSGKVQRARTRALYASGALRRTSYCA